MPEDRKFYVSVSPHVKDHTTVPSIMLTVLTALAPVAILALGLFGARGLLVMSSCVLTAMFTEIVLRRFREKERVQRLYIDFTIIALLLLVTALSPDLGNITQWGIIALLAISVLDELNQRKSQGKVVSDWSAAVTGLLLSFCLPPLVPWWIGAIGSAIAILLGKELFGGLGYNVFNPALVGRAVLIMSWPTFLTTKWFSNLGIDAQTGATAAVNAATAATAAADAVSGATPLALAKGKLIKDTVAYYVPLFMKNPGGCIGEVSAGLLILGGLYLIYKQIIDWRIPAGYLCSVAVMALVFKVDPIFHLLAGGIMVGAFFMATDYVTTCTSPTGKVVFGVGCGFITMLLRVHSGAPEAVTFAILFMNMCAPLIDRMVRPRVFGEVKAA